MDFNNYFPENEKPLDKLLPDGGFASIFRTVACIGDSLSSGEFEAHRTDGTAENFDMFEYSWGQYMARAAGFKVYNFSQGGMTADWYLNSFADEKGFWSEKLKAQAYIIALGVNDVINRPEFPIGAPDDIKSDWRDNEKTFAGYYGAIIQRYKELQPDAKFFLVTMPDSQYFSALGVERAELHSKLIFELADKFDNTYVIDLRSYAPKNEGEYVEKFYLGTHLNPMGYILTAKMMLSYIDYIIRHNMDDFKQTGFIGTDCLKCKA